MGIYSSGSTAVDAMGRIRITGNVIPPRWYREILRDNGRPDHLAVTLLSDIVYWYRPVEVRDEITGQVIGLRKKFKGDLLQKTYEQYANQFGESKRTIKAALDRLEALGLIKKVFRDIVLESGMKIPNVMYIAIHPGRIEEISHEDILQDTSGPPDQKPGEGGRPASLQSVPDADPAEGGTKFCKTPYKKMYGHPQNPVPYPTAECPHVIQNGGGYPAPDVGTNTETIPENTAKNTTETTLETTQDYSPVLSVSSGDMDGHYGTPDHAGASGTVRLTAQWTEDRRTDRDIYIGMLREQVRYGQLCREEYYRDRKETIDGIINVIADIATTDPPDGYERVNGRNYPHEVVKSRLLKTDYELLVHVLDRMDNNCTQIHNLRAYLITALYNARDEMELSVRAQVNYDMYGGGWEEKGIR